MSGAGVAAAIPYTAFPEISLGPLSIRTFGLMVALGVVVGALVAARLNRGWGIPDDRTYQVAVRMVVVGLVASRVTWVVTHWGDLSSPLDAVAVWQGGLQFSGGFLGALAVGWATMRHWPAEQRWRFVDGAAVGLSIGLAIGRIGCYAVGEHLGGTTGFFLGVRYDGGTTREGPLVVGEVIHNTALYEFVHLLVLFAILAWLARHPRVTAGLITGAFCLWYGAWRFATDFLRAYDSTVFGLTGAQYLSTGLVVTGTAILATTPWRARRWPADPGAVDVPSASTSAADEAGSDGGLH